MIAVTESESAVVLEMQGDFSEPAMDEFSRVVGGLIDRRKVQIVLSVRRVGWVSLKSIKWLAGNLKKLRQRNGDIRLTGLSPYWTSLLELTENQNLFGLYPSVEEAVASYRLASSGASRGAAVLSGSRLLTTAAG